MAVQVQESPEYPLYGTTFAIHRLSPLFHGTASLDAPTLAHHASAFRDLLAGEVLRGVRVGLASDDDALSRVGGLQSVRWILLETLEDLLSQSQTLANNTAIFEKDRRGIFVEVTYERGVYSAILLHNDDDAQNENGFSNFPLLLTKMPGTLRETFLDFLAATFDTRASAMKLSSSFITGATEKYLEDITSSEDGRLELVQADKALRTITKDILVTLSFDIPGRSAVKSLDVTLSKDDTSSMILRGRKLQEANRSDVAPGPFLLAVKEYLKTHLALDMGNSQVSISRIACGAFVIAAEGKLKLVAPPAGLNGESPQARATKTLVQKLVEVARGGLLANTALS